MKQLIIYFANDASAKLPVPDNQFEVRQHLVASIPSDITAAALCIIAPDVSNPVKLVQSIFLADKHVSIILLAFPQQMKQVKQNLLFSPFVGKNALVVQYGPDTDLATVCTSAAQRTLQRRSFARLQQTPSVVSPMVQPVRVTDLGAFLEFAPIGAVLFNTKSEVTSFNRQAARMFPALKLNEVSLNEIFPRSAAATVRHFLFDGHDPEHRKEITLDKKVFELTSSEIIGEEGESFYLLLLHDVTHQRQEVQRIRAVLDALPQMGWICNTEGHATHFTRRWYQYTGQTESQAIGIGWTSVVHADDAERLVQAWRSAVKHQKPLQHAARYRNAQGQYRWHLTRGMPVRDADGLIILWVGTCTDINDHILLAEELERKVRERTRSLEMANSELEQFAHLSSHDLQEPLRKIRTFAGLLEEVAYEQLSEDGKRYLSKINQTAERMSSLLRALLNYTRMHREDNFAEIDLNDLMQQVLLDLELLISNKQARIDIEPLPVIVGVPLQMQQLFYNLVNNALKFSRPGVMPHITISADVVTGAEVEQLPSLNRMGIYHRITVADNGIGFDQMFAEKIFTIFQRLHKRTEFEGTGIGLSLVKRIVHNHQGEVFATGIPGEGARFFILLPAEQSK